MRTAVLPFLLGLGCAMAARVEHVAGGPSTESPRAVEIKLTEPFAVDFGANGDWYVCEYKGQRIVRVDKAGKVHLFAGTGSAGYSGDGGPATAATFRDPHGIAVTKNGEMYVADTLNHVIRRIDLKSGIITTVAGTGEKGFAGDGLSAKEAKFDGTFGIALGPSHDKLYIADLNNRRVRMLDLKSGVVTTVAGNGQSSEPEDGSQAAQSPLVDPRAVAVDSAGNLYILERRGNALRVVDKQGRIRTVVRPGSVSPNLNGPKHLCIDRNDNVIIADAENHLVRRYERKSGALVTVAGTGEKGASVDASNPLRTELNRPHGVAVDKTGALYITDSYNHRVLRLTSY